MAAVSSSAFGAALSSSRLLLVAGGSTAGRATVAATAALALARSNRTLLVDADHPAHGMEDVLRVPIPVTTPAPVALPRCSAGGGSLSAVQLCGPTTRSFLEGLLGAPEWKRLLEQDSGTKMAASMGIPIAELLSVLDCIRPPPGVEMPIALARLLTTCTQEDYVVVDAGAAALAGQLQSVPPAVASGLEGFMRFTQIMKLVRKAAFPSVFTSGFNLLVGKDMREGALAQFGATLGHLEELHTATTALAAADKSMLLVLPRHPGPELQRAVERVVDNLQPRCVAFTCAGGLHDPNNAGRPDWLPPGPEVVSIPLSDGRSSQRVTGVETLSTLGDIMLAS